MSTTDTDLFILLPLIYMIPTYFLYLVELLTLFVNRKGNNFTGSFFRIWVSSAGNNLLCSILYFLTFRGTKAPALSGFYSILPESGFFTTLLLFIVYISGSVQVLLDLVLCFNRFTVVFLETDHTIFWNKYGRIILFFTFCIPVTTSWEAWFFQIKLLPVNASDWTEGYNWSPTNAQAIPWMNIPLIVCGTVIATASLSFFMNCYVCWYLLKENKKNKIGGRRVSNHDLRLFIYNMLIFLTQMVHFCLQMIFLISPKEHVTYSFAVKIQYFVMDVNALAPAWFIFFMSSVLRTSIMRLFSNNKTLVVKIHTSSFNGKLTKKAGITISS